MPFARICKECGDVLMVKTRKKAEGTLCFLCSSIKKMENFPPKVKKVKIKKDKKFMSKSKIPLESQISIGSVFKKQDEKKYPRSTPEQDAAMMEKWLKNNKVKEIA